MLAAGGLATLVRLTSAPAAELRVNAAWALQNLMHHASPDVRAAVLAALPWERVEALAADADARVQVGARLLPSTACAGRPARVERVLTAAEVAACTLAVPAIADIKQEGPTMACGASHT